MSPGDGQRTRAVTPWADTEMMSPFLAEVAKEHPDDYILMFLGRAGWHGSKDLHIPSGMALEFVPPHSPECNPAEHLWEDIRENHFGNDAMESMEQVDANLTAGFRSLHANPERAKSMACFSWMKERI